MEEATTGLMKRPTEDGRATFTDEILRRRSNKEAATAFVSSVSVVK